MSKDNVYFEWAKTSQELQAEAVNLLGFGYDGTACFRKGTVDGPNALREISDGIESYSPYLNLDLEDWSFYDLGNLPVGDSEDLEKNWFVAVDAFREHIKNRNIDKENIRLLTLGGEHSISYAPIVEYLKTYDDLVLLHLDAHADLRDGYLGFKYSHASIIRRVLDHFGEGHQLIQYGIRSGTRDEYIWMKEKGTLKTSREDFLDSVKNINSKRPIYLTLDLDYFDPSFFPGTGTPEPGGEDFHSFIKLIKILKEKNLVGADAVELAPNIDPTGNSSVFAAKVVRELILLLAEGIKR